MHMHMHMLAPTHTWWLLPALSAWCTCFTCGSCAVQHAPPLRHVFFTDNVFDNDGLVALAWGLSGNTSLHSITLGSKPHASCSGPWVCVPHNASSPNFTPSVRRNCNELLTQRDLSFKTYFARSELTIASLSSVRGDPKTQQRGERQL